MLFRSLRLIVTSSFSDIFRSHLAQLLPQVEALNIFSLSFIINIKVFVPPDNASGDILPNTGLSIRLHGKDAAKIISRINGFTFVETEMDYSTGEVKEISRTAYSDGLRSKVNCYGANDVTEGVAIMWKENVDISITGNSTNPTRFQHPVAGTYKKERLEAGKKYFSVASGGGTGRTLHPDNMAAGPASYGMTDTMGRMHSDAQFAGSSSVPAHVEMMGLIGMGNNPMVGATVAVAVSVEEAAKACKERFGKESSFRKRSRLCKGKRNACRGNHKF